jgi:primosomal protein N' (replication factor Y) (superfamily II helicase)
MPSGLSEYAEVAVPVAVHGTFTYAIPHALRDVVRLGSRVEVPFGAKRNTAFVVALTDRPPESGKIKPILGVLDDDEPALLP